MAKAERKAQYIKKLLGYFDEFTKVFIVQADNVGSNQLQKIRQQLRGRAEVLMGKNTLIRKGLRGIMVEKPELAALMPAIKGNIGLVFTNDDLMEIRSVIEANKVQAPARAGAIAPVDVFVPQSNTGMGPEKTSFFQALNIQTKIARGTIEIVSDVHLIKVGDKVGASEATLLNMLNISPFAYGLVITSVFDNGSLYSPSVLDIKTEDLIAKFISSVGQVTGASMGLGYVNRLTVPHIIANSFKNILAVAVATDITFPLAESAKEFLADPEAALAALSASAAANVTESVSVSDNKKEAEPVKEEEEEESDEEGMFDMFG